MKCVHLHIYRLSSILFRLYLIIINVCEKQYVSRDMLNKYSINIKLCNCLMPNFETKGDLDWSNDVPLS